MLKRPISYNLAIPFKDLLYLSQDVYKDAHKSAICNKDKENPPKNR